MTSFDYATMRTHPRIAATGRGCWWGGGCVGSVVVVVVVVGGGGLEVMSCWSLREEKALRGAL